MHTHPCSHAHMHTHTHTHTHTGPDRPTVSLDTSPHKIQRHGEDVTETLCSIQDSAMSVTTVLMWEGPGLVEPVRTANKNQLELDLNSFEQEETGEYVCTATNGRGNSSMSVYVYGKLGKKLKILEP